MADERLRRSERESVDDVEAEARLLTGRLRAGQLSAEQLSLTAYLGHVAARGVVEAEGQALQLADLGDLRAWVQGLAEFGEGAVRRAAAALGACGRSDARREEADDWRALGNALDACALLGPVVPKPAVGFAAGLHLVCAAWDDDGAAGSLQSAIGNLCGRRALEDLGAAIRDELVPWALGAADPVRERLGPERVRALVAQSMRSDDPRRVQLLLERLGLGEFAPERLGLAAYLGDLGAMVAFGQGAPHVPEDLTLWWLGLRDFGAEVVARSALALAALMASCWQSRVGVPYPRPLRSAIQNLARGLTGAGPATPTPQAGLALRPRSADPVELAAWNSLAHAVRVPNDPAAHALALEQACLALGDEAEAQVREAVAEELLPWVLGVCDPALSMRHMSWC